jgi:1,2-dihydroxy-3-keto-5-methylthiopentene dioxygenase
MVTRIFVFDGVSAHRRDVVEGDAVTHHLATLGVDHERWPVRPLAADADPAAVLAAYGAEVERLTARHGYRSVDVVRMQPDNPNREAARAKFLDEHLHDDDETRFFVEGSGIFYLHVDGAVHAVLCTAGDLLRVPAGTLHWFDMGTAPHFCAIRLFSRPDGWQASFTGDPISERIPYYDTLARE